METGRPFEWLDIEKPPQQLRLLMGIRRDRKEATYHHARCGAAEVVMRIDWTKWVVGIRFYAKGLLGDGGVLLAEVIERYVRAQMCKRDRKRSEAFKAEHPEFLTEGVPPGINHWKCETPRLAVRCVGGPLSRVTGRLTGHGVMNLIGPAAEAKLARTLVETLAECRRERRNEIHETRSPGQHPIS